MFQFGSGINFLPRHRADSLCHFLCIRPAVECANSKVTFAGGAKSSARGDNHSGLVEHLVKNIPAGRAVGCLHPNVRCVGAAENLKPGFGGSFAQQLGVAHVVVNEVAYLPLAGLGVDGGGGALDGVARAIEFRGHAASP